ncbi:hypothetical protein CPC08DRAFT_705720 [Agrocybe pediades]|nr:hypothetical protein CPC08DRAFT_705720 [Agrocybe pediades]
MASSRTSGKSDYVARGLKATIHNPNTSDEAKQSAVHRLEDQGEELPEDYRNMKEQGIGGHEELRGGSGGISRSSVSDQNVKAPGGGSAGRSRITGAYPAAGEDDDDEEINDLMDDIGDVVDEDYTKDISGKEHNRVLGGYKATLKNPRVSDEAKQHAQDKLDEFI